MTDDERERLRREIVNCQPAEEEGFERSLLRADIKAGNADAAEAQLQRIKRLEAEKEGT